MKRVLKEYKETIGGQKVTVKVIEPKERAKKVNRKRATSICPECGSKMVLNELGAWKCTGNILKVWEKLLKRYHVANAERKVEILKEISDVDRFEELYWRWVNSIENEAVKFECGYTNRLFPPIATNQSNLPDPIFTKRVERRLGRKLTKEEILGEKDLWYYRGQYFVKYRKNAKKVKIPIITLPDDVMTKEIL